MMKNPSGDSNFILKTYERLDTELTHLIQISREWSIL